MKQNTDTPAFYNAVILFPFLLVLALWGIYWLEVTNGISFNTYGIYPRDSFGLIGILCSAFIHGSTSHLYQNTIPVFVLTMALFYFYPKIKYHVLVYGILLSGLFTWLFARAAYHIGISGLIYVLASFLFFKGLFLRHYRHVALSLLVVFLYGSMVWYVLPIKEGISWEGHLSGAVAGFILTFLGDQKKQVLIKYDWQAPDYDPSTDPFMQQFDAQGNFNPPKKQENQTHTGLVWFSSNTDTPVVYTVKQEVSSKD